MTSIRQEEITNRIAEVKLKRILELNTRLRDTLDRERIRASDASLLIIDYVQKTPDYIISDMWTLPTEENKFHQFKKIRSKKSEMKASGCCSIM
ncbi:Piso0_002745 [Millerozyma farinosa CBS 7064]|uniref:Guanine nucleotide-binding protein subunit gamma n=1 Tax=Pichia sorbitophila (strain ATCC MYA-4447 / BCRC 22081 / CBS 7064 / NBRC 10061 / NRRL Y-12695) TaxID=559304 RepID=G8YDE3_PICSO|nr:Piso0_002745 [Millerozyma farinosa CBS 7064]